MSSLKVLHRWMGRRNAFLGLATRKPVLHWMCDLSETDQLSLKD